MLWGYEDREGVAKYRFYKYFLFKEKGEERIKMQIFKLIQANNPFLNICVSTIFLFFFCDANT